MNNALPIRTYKDLVLEEQRLSVLADWHKDQIRADVQEIKKQLAPMTRIVSFVGRLASPVQKHPLLGAGIGVGAGLLAEKALGSIRPIRWLAGLAAPFFAKKAGSLFQRLSGKKPAR
jgi:hypothetical protein